MKEMIQKDYGKDSLHDESIDFVQSTVSRFKYLFIYKYCRNQKGVHFESHTNVLVSS